MFYIVFVSCDDYIRKTLDYDIRAFNYFFKPVGNGELTKLIENVEGGLVHHTKLAVRIAKELTSNGSVFNSYTSHDKDLIFLSLILHDGFKHGETEEKYVRFDHPIIAAEFVKKNGVEVGLTEEETNILHDVIASHMGEFNTSTYSKVVLPLPKTNMEKFVHLCDDLSSKKFFNVDFDENDNIVE